MKKVSFGLRPKAREQTADEWVAGHTLSEPTKRLTIDLPLSLHRRIKVQCATEDLVIADVVRDLLSKRFPEETKEVPFAIQAPESAS